MLPSQRVMLPRAGVTLGRSESVCHAIGLLSMRCFILHPPSSIIEHTRMSRESAICIKLPMGIA